jgi:hypothetical protein
VAIYSHNAFGTRMQSGAGLTQGSTLSPEVNCTHQCTGFDELQCMEGCLSLLYPNVACVEECTGIFGANADACYTGCAARLPLSSVVELPAGLEVVAV